MGVTGAIGGGKSTFARMLAEVFRAAGRSCTVLNADELARELLESHPGAASIRSALAARFGADILSADGTLDRAALSARAFADDAAAADLNAIVHPRVVAEAAARTAGEGIHILDVPLLFESGMDRLCDTTIAVTAPRAARLERAARFGNAEARERRQWPEERKADLARHIVANHGTLEDLAAHAASLAQNLLPIDR